MSPPEAAEACLALLRASGLGGWRVLAVAGESGAGKSTLGEALAARAGAALLHQDDYFRLPPAENHAARVQDPARVGPGEVDLERLAAHAAAFIAGATRVQPPLLAAPVPLLRPRLVVEGTYVLALPTLDAGIFIDRTFLQTRADRARRGRDPMDPFIEQVLLREQPQIRALAPRARVVLDADFTPRLREA